MLSADPLGPTSKHETDLGNSPSSRDLGSFAVGSLAHRWEREEGCEATNKKGRISQPDPALRKLD